MEGGRGGGGEGEGEEWGKKGEGGKGEAYLRQLRKCRATLYDRA